MSHYTLDAVYLARAMQFGISKRQYARLTKAMCWQLCQCRTDEARRLILGVSH